MAKKTNKKNFAKHLPRAGSTLAVAMAMTVALSTQANATELEDDALLGLDMPPADSVAETSTDADAGLIVASETNEAIDQENTGIMEQNDSTAENNTQIEQDNNAAAEKNEAVSGGELADPNLDLPEAPAAPDTEGMDEETYNEAVGEYNENVGGYNQAVDGYNEAVDGYNAEADAYDEEAQKQYEEDLKQYEEDKAAHEEAVQEYEEQKAQHEADTQAYEAYLKAQAEFEAAQKKYEEDLAKFNEENAQHEADTQAYEAYLKAQAEYEAAQKLYQEELAKYNEENTQYQADTQAYEAYLKAQAEFEAAQKKYEEDLAKFNEENAQHEADTQAYEAYLKAQAEFEAAQKKYEEDMAKFNAENTQYQADVKAYEDYLKAQAEYDSAYQHYLAQVEKYRTDYAKYELDQKAYEDYLAAKAQYDAAKEAFDKVYEAYVAENSIYIDVTDYNKDVQEKNEAIEDQNTALENDLHADTAENIDNVSQINQNLNIAPEILETLNGHDELAAQHKNLLSEAAALDAHTGKNAALGSDEYAVYLAAVEAYNEKVTEFNKAVDSYNKAVTTYNAAVETYNANKPEDSSTSTGVGTEQGDGSNIDWGNVNFTTYQDLTHIDVKYNAAASKTKTENADGSESYSDSVTQYTVTGVYTDEAAAKKNSSKYSLSYSNDNWATSTEQALKKDPSYDEFGNTDPAHLGESLDPVTGKVRFYVTMTDSDGNAHGITVDMDANSVYAEGSYYKAKFDYWGNETDFLDRYVGQNGRKLDVVYIDGEKYYDVSGESVFLISALTCDGMTEGWSWGGHSSGKLTAHGLDLILNMQTMIEIHQSDNAQKINFVSYELGKTAQAEAPNNPGEFTEEEPEEVTPPEKPNEPIFTETEPDPVDEPTPPTLPTAPTAPDFVEDPGDAPIAPTAPIAPDFVEDPGDAPIAPTAPTAPDFVEEPGDAPIAPTAPEAPDFVEDPGEEPQNPGEFDQTAPEAPQPTDRMEYAEKLEILDEKVIVEIVNPEPEVTDGDVEIPELEPALEIPDEMVPLAEAPKTGDLSSLWAFLSSFSLGGMALLNRKRKEEE